MSAPAEHRRKPKDISKSMVGVIRRLQSLEDSLRLEVLPDELISPVCLAIEHLTFLRGDLLIELERFNAKYKIPPSISQ